MDSITHRGDSRTLRKLVQYTRRYKSRMILAVACSGMVSLLSVISLTILKPVVEAIFTPESYSRQFRNTQTCPNCGHAVYTELFPIPHSHAQLLAPAADQANSQTDIAAEDFRYCPNCGWHGYIHPVGLGRLQVILTPFYYLLQEYASTNPLATLAVACICFLFLIAVNGVFRYVQEYMVYWVGNRVVMDLQHDLFERLSVFHAAYFARQRVGAILSYLTVDIRTMNLTVFSVMGRLMLDPLILAAAVGFLLWLQWQLTILYSLVFPLIFLTMKYYSKKNRRAGREAQNITARLGAFLQEHFSHIRLVQGYGMMEYQREKFWTETKGVFCASMSMVKAKAASSPLNEFLGLVAVCGVLLFGGYVIFHSHSFTGGDFVVYVALLGTIYQPVKRLERSIQDVQHGLAAAERVFGVLETEAFLPEAPDAIDLEDFESEIRFEEIDFSYEAGRPVLSQVSFTAHKGELVALVGPSGAGKTTLVNLIPRFYDPDSGRILLDGRDIRTLRLTSLRKLISIVPQDVLIFGDSVWANITCGDERFRREEVITAAQAAFAHEFILELPQGYDTYVGERGVSLSGGQCQRLAIARALLRNSPILILDEATSSLDSESERTIKQSLERLMQGRTAFVIAHRLSTILHADKIVVLDQGKVVSIGTHQELLRDCRLYQRLYHLQFAGDALKSNADAETPLLETV